MKMLIEKIKGTQKFGKDHYTGTYKVTDNKD